jgi:hypothetical protein
LVGQVLRAGERAGFHRILADPSTALNDEVGLRTRLDEAVAFAAFTLVRRHQQLGDADDYRKNFKNKQELGKLAKEAEDYFGLQNTMPKIAPASSSPAS